MSADTMLRYDELAAVATHVLHGTLPASQIEKDLLRTFPSNRFFYDMDAEGTQRLRRVLITAAWTLPTIGYAT